MLVRAEGGQIKVLTRRARNIASLLPELALLAGVLGRRRALLDGELVAFGHRGWPLWRPLPVSGSPRAPRHRLRGRLLASTATAAATSIAAGC